MTTSPDPDARQLEMVNSLPVLKNAASDNSLDSSSKTPTQPPNAHVHSSRSSSSSALTAMEKNTYSLDTPFVLKEKAVPPPKIEPTQVTRAIWFFTAYRRLFLLVFTFNLVSLIITATGHFPYARNHIGAFLLGNLTTAVLVRNEFFLRIVFFIVNHTLARWPPLSIRLAATSTLQHLGGVHSGCATSTLMWIIYKMSTVNLLQFSAVSKANLAMGTITAVAIATSAASAIPWFRNHHHNKFERVHRFVGWFGVAATWVFVAVGDCYNTGNGVCDHSVRKLIGDQQFWFILCISVFICIPWAFTRKVEVHVDVPSPKMVIVRFRRGMQQGLLGRISRSSVLEYHAFGIVSEGPQAEYHYMVCGVQGDFTKGLVNDPPTHLWTREIKFAGVSNTSKLYKRGVRICTGTGIGAGLSTCLQEPGWFLIWIGSDLRKTFGEAIWGLCQDKIEPGRKLLWDSKERGGRPKDVCDLLEEVYRAWEAEVVFITSNDAGNREMMLGCMERNIPVFGTIFDF